MQFLNNHNILYQKHLGFQKKISTAHAIYNLIEDIKKSLGNKQSVCTVYLDLQKACETVNHNIK